MGNGGSALSLCLSRRPRRRRRPAVAAPALDEGFGRSFCYVRPEPGRPSVSRVYSEDFSGQEVMPFRSISGAYVGANSSAGLSRDGPLLFESSPSFASLPLQPVPRSSTSSAGSGPVERGFLSGPIERAFLSGPVRKASRVKRLKRSLSSSLHSSFFSFLNCGRKTTDNSNNNSNNNNIILSNEDCSQMSNCDHEPGMVQWAQGKAGEDRVHIVIYEENGVVFVGIYDGFNGPDAPDFLLSNLFGAIDVEIKELLRRKNFETCLEGSDSESRGFRKVGKKDDPHRSILKSMEAALKKTEAGFLEANERVAAESPELALMGSCVLVMVMKGEDVYLMNVGDSRVVLATDRRQDTCVGDTRISLDRICENDDDGDDDDLTSLTALQLTVDHSTEVEEEVERLVKEHPEDSRVIVNERVKGSLKVTRAFGAGFLKQPKMNEALLGRFKVDYVGSSPYLTCSPSLYHYGLSAKDKFLILSSDGLYQYFTNEEVVSEVEMFLESFPEGDPAQYLIEIVLFRAAKKEWIFTNFSKYHKGRDESTTTMFLSSLYR